MKFAQFAVKNSLFVNLFSVFVLIAGTFSVINLKREAFPPVDFNTVIVMASLRSASAEKIERLVTIPIEREIRKVSNIEEILSTSNEGISTIYVNIDHDAKDLRKVTSDIQKAVDRVSGLPDEMTDKPIVYEITSGEIPILKVSLSGDIDEHSMRKHTESLEDAFLNTQGVSSVYKNGFRDEEYWIEPNIKSMLKYHISFSELASTVRAQNVDSPGGKIELAGVETTVKIKGELKNKEDIENTVIRSNDLGNWIRVKDVAKVSHTFSDVTEINKSFGAIATTFTVTKQENADILKTVKNLYQSIDSFKKFMPSKLKISTFHDMSYYVNRRLNVLKSNGLIACIMVIFILFMFMPPRGAIVTALGIPIAMLTTFTIMFYTNVTINLMTMFGLIMVLGMVVDDGIIIAENVYRHIESGIHPRQAAVIGTNEVARPVLTTILTTIVAFSPLMMMTGLIGKIVKFIPLMVILALIASLIEAFFILPSHLADFAKPIDPNKERKESMRFKGILNFYTKILQKAVNHRYITIGLVFGVFIIAMFLAVFIMFPRFQLFSSAGVEQFSVLLEAKPSTTLDKTNQFIIPAEELIGSLSSKYLDTYETTIGSITQERGFDPSEKRGSNYAQVEVHLTPLSQRDKTAAQLIETMEPRLKKIFEELKPLGVEKLYFKSHKEGPPSGSPLDIRVRGDDFSVALEIMNQIKEYASNLPGVKDLRDNYNLGSQELHITIDEEKAQKAFLTNSQIAYAVRAAFSGITATTIKREKAEKEIRVLVRLPKKERNDPEILNKIVVANKFGNLIPLKNVTTSSKAQSLRSIKHLDGKRTIALTGEVKTKEISSLKANMLIKEKFKDLATKYPGYSIRFEGEDKESMESIHSLLRAGSLALLLIYLILATQFNSLLQPFVVMLNIPFGLIGVVFAFLAHNEPLSFLAIMGLVGLTGVAVNDSIVLVDFINKRRDHKPIKEAVIEAGRLRLRPVLLTTITTVFGLSTVAYGIGGFDPFLKPMALAISWGLVFATGLTLIVIPCIYLIAEDIKVLFLAKFAKKAA